MSLALPEVTKAKLIDVNPRSEKHGPHELVPAIDLRFEVDSGNAVLGQYSPDLLDALYEPSTQLPLDGVPKVSDRPKLRLPHLAMPLRWEGESQNNNLTLDHGIGGESNVVLTGCKVHKHVITAKEGGTCTIAFTVSCAHDLTKEVVGSLGTRVQHDVYLQLQPAEQQSDHDATEVDTPVEADAQ